MLDLLFGGGSGWFGIPAILGTIFFVQAACDALDAGVLEALDR